MYRQTMHRATSGSEHRRYGQGLWYVPDSRIRSKSAVQQAERIADSVNLDGGLEPAPTEEEIFAALHTCAYRASRRGVSAEEQTKWTGRWKAVREYIVQRNLGLVYSMLGRFSTRRADEDDLLSDAMLALTRAVDRFNPWRGYRFSTYACNVIARALMRRGKRESNYRRLFPVQHDVSFERDDVGGTVNENSDLYVERLRLALDSNLGELTELECHILAKRFPAAQGSRLTFQEIGSTVGLSKERVRQIQNVALEKLREVLTADPILQ